MKIITFSKWSGIVCRMLAMLFAAACNEKGNSVYSQSVGPETLTGQSF